MSKVGRNDPCPCGSGKKYKQCHGAPGAGELPRAAIARASAPHALVMSGLQMQQSNRLDEAEQFYRRALELAPRNSDALHLLGTIRHQQGRHPEAVEFIERAIKANPTVASYYTNCGEAYRSAGQLERAVACYDRAIKVQPDFAEAYVNRGVAERQLGKLDQAEASYLAAIRLRPGLSEAHKNLALLFKQMRCLDKAIVEFDIALKLRGNDATALNDLGLLYGETGDLPQALGFIARALALDPADNDVRANHAYALLAVTEFKQGWIDYEARFLKETDPVPSADFPQPFWRGQYLDGAGLLTWQDQGVGDAIWFSGMFRELLDGPARRGRVVIEVASKLVGLFSRSFPDAVVVGRGEPADARCREGVDWQIAGGSLGRYLRTSLADFPRREASGGAYLFADGVRERYWKQKLEDGNSGLKVGISWRSTNNKGERALACTRLGQWGNIFKVPGVRFVNLQYDDCEQELKEAEREFGITIERHPELDMFNDLDETAALMRNLDLVISAPTSVSVLSAALGVPTWQMNYGVEWQCHGQPNNPWYPAMRNYVRRWDEPWEYVLSKIARELAALRRVP